MSHCLGSHLCHINGICYIFRMKLFMVIYEIATYASIVYLLGQIHPNLAYALVVFTVYQVVTSVHKAYQTAKFVKQASKAFDDIKQKEALDALMGRNSDAE